jgi:hypothetical protein
MKNEDFFAPQRPQSFFFVIFVPLWRSLVAAKAALRQTRNTVRKRKI